MAKIHEQLTNKNWCRRNFAQNKEGHQAGSLDKDAVAWCMVGWLTKNYPKATLTEHLEMERTIRLLLPKGTFSIPYFNDHKDTTVEMVQEIYKKADL